jgi:universal stress protein E
MERFKRILLYADPAAKIEPALRYAVRVARHNHGVITVVGCLHSDSPPEPMEVNRDCPQCVQLEREQRELGSPAKQETRTRLEDICQQLRNEGVPATTKVLVGRSAVEIIREVLRSGHGVVMTTAQGTGANKERAFFDTTALALMRNALVRCGW